MRTKISLPDKICEQCGKFFNRKKRPSGVLEAPTEFKNRRFCSLNCSQIWHCGTNHQNYKDGLKHGHDGGYIRYTNGQYVHRVIMSEHLGRPLLTEEHVHHIDGNPTNNKIENLELTTNSKHRKGHAAIQPRDKEGRFV